MNRLKCFTAIFLCGLGGCAHVPAEPPQVVQRVGEIPDPARGARPSDVVIEVMAMTLERSRELKVIRDDKARASLALQNAKTSSIEYREVPRSPK